MNKTTLTLEASRRLTADVWELALSGDTSAFARPGQFVNLALPGKFLRRPISVANWTDEGVLLLVRAAGAGTRELVSAPAGTRFDALTGLGNGFDTAACGPAPILAGGGIGLAPLYGLARRLVGIGVTPTVVLGFRSQADAFYLEEFALLGARLFVATEDGSLGTRGFVTDCLAAAAPAGGTVCACGPMPMLRALAALPGVTGQFSLESRMGCGFGVCMGCTVATTDGPRRVCADGPVFQKEALQW
jgi:dihydroorotate dehydrogenase electron transfer subunit